MPALYLKYATLPFVVLLRVFTRVFLYSVVLFYQCIAKHTVFLKKKKCIQEENKCNNNNNNNNNNNFNSKRAMTWWRILLFILFWFFYFIFLICLFLYLCLSHTNRCICRKKKQTNRRYIITRKLFRACNNWKTMLPDLKN